MKTGQLEVPNWDFKLSLNLSQGMRSQIVTAY